MSKHIKPARTITIEQTDEYSIVYTPADKDYALTLTGLGLMGYYPSADAARMMVADYRENGVLEPTNACAGWGCVDGCGDCQAEPAIATQLAAKGMREAHGEQGAYTNVRQDGRIIQVWAVAA